MDNLNRIDDNAKNKIIRLVTINTNSMKKLFLGILCHVMAIGSIVAQIQNDKIEIGGRNEQDSHNILRRHFGKTDPGHPTTPWLESKRTVTPTESCALGTLKAKARLQQQRHHMQSV